MKIPLFVVAAAILISGCSHQDPIERLMHEVSHEDVPSYPFKPIELPATATPEQLVSALSKRSVLDLGHFDFGSYKILEVRPVETESPMPPDTFTAVLLDTSLGKKIVLLRPLQHGTNLLHGTNWTGWYYRTYDAK
jgi:hypothetical protein